MSNRKLLESAGIIESDAKLTAEQETAIESLSKEEVNAIISAKDKLAGAFPAKTNAEKIGGIIHHHHHNP